MFLVSWYTYTLQPLRTKAKCHYRLTARWLANRIWYVLCSQWGSFPVLKSGVLPVVGGQSARSNMISVPHLSHHPLGFAPWRLSKCSQATSASPSSTGYNQHGWRSTLHMWRFATMLRDCVVYTLVAAQRTLLEVQPCQNCPPISPPLHGPSIIGLVQLILLLDDYRQIISKGKNRARIKYMIENPFHCQLTVWLWILSKCIRLQ